MIGGPTVVYHADVYSLVGIIQSVVILLTGASVVYIRARGVCNHPRSMHPRGRTPLAHTAPSSTIDPHHALG